MTPGSGTGQDPARTQSVCVQWDQTGLEMQLSGGRVLAQHVGALHSISRPMINKVKKNLFKEWIPTGGFHGQAKDTPGTQGTWVPLGQLQDSVDKIYGRASSRSVFSLLKNGFEFSGDYNSVSFR